MLIRLSLVIFNTLLITTLGCNPQDSGEHETRSIDFVHYLEGVRTPADSALAEHHAVVRVGPDSVLTTLRWRTFQIGGSRYLHSASLEIPADTQGSALSFTESKSPFNMGTKEAVLMAVTVLISWDKNPIDNQHFGTESGTITADGRWLPS